MVDFEKVNVIWLRVPNIRGGQNIVHENVCVTIILLEKKGKFYSLSNTCKLKSNYPAGIYLLEVNNRNTKTKYEICSELSIKIPERRYAEHNSDSTVPAKLSKSLEKLEIDDVIGSLQTAVLISTTAIFRRVLNL